MPFENERASYRPLHRILSSDKVRQLQQRFRIKRNDECGSEKVTPPLLDSREAGNSRRQPDMLLAIDGSYHDTPVENGFPGAEIGYITVASVLILLDKLRDLSREEIIDPVEFRKSKKTASIDTAVPGCNVVVDDELTPQASMRRVIFEEMMRYRVFDDSETLLDTYESLFDQGADSIKCPHDGTHDYLRNQGKYNCRECGKILYSTDAMRFHELFEPSDSCRKMYGHIMFTLERLWLVHALRAFERKGWLPVIGDMAFVLDGPLAIYGTPSWLSQPIFRELHRINEAQKTITGADMMILGVEKSGQFARHFEMIDTHKDGAPKKFDAGKFMLLTNGYIRDNIVRSETNKPYGRGTYFGRKFFYKTELGHRLVVNTACYNKWQMDISTAEPEKFPRLADTLNLLDALSSNLYPNSLSPLISAHSEAAIPLYLGGKILDNIARKLINSNDD